MNQRKSLEELQSDTRFFGHPLPLMQLFSLEMWERFSYYGMNGILAIYLYFSVTDGGLGMDQTVALGIVGAYGGAVFLCTILGAWVADRIVGAERVLFYSSIIIMAGHICLALVPGTTGLGFGLVLVALGSGGLKANASALVGKLYTEKDPRREAGFSLFYMGVNTGAFLGPLLTGLLQKDIGFHIAFGAAAVGMFIGLVIYATGRGSMPEDARHPVNPLERSKLYMFLGLIALIIVVIVVAWMTGVVNAENLDWWIAGISFAAAMCYFVVMSTAKGTTAIERNHVLAYVPFFLASIVFWSLYQQVFGVLTTYSETQMDRMIFGWEMPINWIQLIPAILVIVMAPIFSMIWLKLGTKQPSTPLKASLSLVSIGIGFLLFLPYANAGENATPVLWIVLILAFFVIGELMISPIGLAYATKLAPAKFTSQMIAVNFLASGVGTALSGVLAQYYHADNQVPYWTSLGLASIGFGLLLLLIVKPTKKLLHGVL